MAFDSIIFINGPLKIRRPKDHGGTEMIQASVHVPDVVSTNVPDSINKVFVGNLPAYLREERAQELWRTQSLQLYSGKRKWVFKGPIQSRMVYG